MKTDELLCKIFEIKTESEFLSAALDIFRFQYEHTSVYRSFVDLMKVKENEVDALEKIPFLPIEFFKSHEITTNHKLQNTTHKVFTSSGTTGQTIKSFKPLQRGK